MVQESVERSGVVADGVTTLLLRMRSDESVKFSVRGLEDGFTTGHGELSRLDGSTSADPSEVTVTPVSHCGRNYAFALYQPPGALQHGPTAPPLGEFLEFLAKKLSSGLEQSKSIRLFQPPVILVHGIWSDRRAWESLEGVLRNQGFYVCEGCRVDYGTKQPAASFDPNAIEAIDQYAVRTVIGAMRRARQELRELEVAVTKVDVVGHSMGGLIARSRVQSSYSRYSRKSN